MTNTQSDETFRSKASSLDVAKLAKVSRATVSRCFTPGATVRESTKSRVLAAARELGYEPNLLARMLNTQESSIVAVLTSDFSNPFQPALMQVLSETLRQEGFTPLLLKATSMYESADDLIQLALSYRVAAIVVTVLTASNDIVARCSDSGVPVIMLNRIAEDSRAISVCSNAKSGAERIAEVLIEGSATRIGMITGPVGSWSNSMRRGGFRRRLDELGYDIAASGKGNFSYESGVRSAMDLLASDPRIDAIYACNDAMAFGALDAIRLAGGRSVPGDIAVIGFDDVPMAAWGAYRLSTIQQPIAKLIEQVRMILGRADKGLALSGQIFLHDSHFIQRQTTRPVSLRPHEIDETVWTEPHRREQPSDHPTTGAS